MANDRVLIVGTGAIGGFYGALLARAGAEVSVVCRSDYAAAKQSGYRILSDALGSWDFRPSQIIRSADAYQGDADYVILCSKIVDGVDRIELVRPAISPHTVLVFIQNGVETEQELFDAFPANQIVSGLAFICCNRIKPAEIQHLAYGKLTLGNYPSDVSAKTRHLAGLFEKAGIECQTLDDIVTGRWIKCVWNAPFNPLSVLSGGLTTLDILSTQEPFVRTIMDEVQILAAACGHPLPADIIERHINNTYSMPPYKTSMLLDFENGRPMETEAILGNAVRAAQREDIRCPNLSALYALMRLREQKEALGEPA